MMTNGEPDYEGRKLDALLSISTAIVSLGESLAVVVRQSLDQSQALKVLDSKLDSLINIVTSK